MFAIYKIIGVFALFVFVVTNVHALSIISDNSSTSIDTFIYNIEPSSLGISDSYTITNYTDNSTNMTYSIIENISHQLNFICTLNISNMSSDPESRTYNESNVTNIYDDFIISQPIKTLFDGNYVSDVSCTYNVTTINQTSNISSNATIVTMSSIVIANETSKTITIDTMQPIITLIEPNISPINISNASGMPIRFNFTIDDASSSSCTWTLNASNNMTVNSTSIHAPPRLFNVSVQQSLIPGHYVSIIDCIDVFNNSAHNAFAFDIFLMNASNNTINSTNSTSTTNNTEPFFSITLNTQELKLGELGYYTISANNGSNVSITICPIQDGWVQCYVAPEFINDTYPKTMAMPYGNKSGYYLIDGVMHYENRTIHANATFIVSNTLTASITASKTTAGKGELITFNTSAASGIPPYNYRWVMDDGAVFNGPGAYKTFNSAGQFTEWLFANDSQNNRFNTSQTITIKENYRLTVVTYDKNNGQKLNNVLVEVNDRNVTTDSNGEAVFDLMEGTYDIYASRDGYGGVLQDFSLRENKTASMNLSFDDSDPPQVDLLTDDNMSFTKENVALKFKGSDITPMYCELYTALANDSWYTLKDQGGGLASNTEYTFNINDLDFGDYKWKVTCKDTNNNSQTTEARTFSVVGSTALTESNDKASDDINRALDGLATLSIDETQIAEKLGIKTALEDLLDRSNSLQRDIYDVSFRRDLDDKGKEETRKNITDRLENLRKQTPVSLSVSNTKTFVKYVHDDDLAKIMEDYISSKNLVINNKAFLKYTKSVQSRAVISTKVSNVVLSYMDGRTSEITLITRTINVPLEIDRANFATSNAITIIEVIPKSITPSIDSINILNKDYTVVKSDPIIEFKPTVTEISYYINKSINPDEFQTADTIIVDKNIKETTTATGFITIDSLKNIPTDGKSIMIAIIVLLVLVYVFINFNIIQGIGKLFGNNKKRITYLRVLVNDALDYLKTGDYDKAALIYREIKLNYENATEFIQKEVFEECYTLCNKMDVYYFNELLTEIDELLKSSRNADASLDYQKLEKTYDKIDELYKKDLLGTLEDAFKRIEKTKKI
jgi:hypothetical protein